MILRDGDGEGKKKEKSRQGARFFYKSNLHDSGTWRRFLNRPPTRVHSRAMIHQVQRSKPGRLQPNKQPKRRVFGRSLDMVETRHLAIGGLVKCPSERGGCRDVGRITKSKTKIDDVDRPKILLPLTKRGLPIPSHLKIKLEPARLARNMVG